MSRLLPLLLLGLGAALVLPAQAAKQLALPTPVEDEGHRGLAAWFTALARAEGKTGVARALHYGDSTIAADGIAKTVRGRLQARFGDAGPGFVTAAFDPSWNKRSDVAATRSGSWTLRTILLGGGGGRYGLGGIVAVARPGAKVALRAVDSAGQPRPQKHLELWYQAGVGYGELWATADGKEVIRGSAVAAATEDRRVQIDLVEGYTELVVGADKGPVPYYGLVLESGAPGATWEALGVIGVGSRSFSLNAAAHLPAQTTQRSPDLIVLMIGGNEAGYPALLSPGGAAYQPIYREALKTVRAGAPGASCLVVTPLDQAAVSEEDGVARSKPGMPNLVAAQRQVAKEEGCAFWSAWDAMGGKGSAVRWTSAGMGLGDYVHFTAGAQEQIANRLADALLAAYDDWKAGGAAPAAGTQAP